MTGKERKEIILRISERHKACRNNYLASGSSHERGMAFGNMIGIEWTAIVVGLNALANDLADLRSLECKALNNQSGVAA